MTGATVIVSNVWNHAAATYDGTNWNLYLNGVLDGTFAINQPAQSNSIQHAGFASSLQTAGNPNGFFGGTLDEPRIWNHARSVMQIRAGMIAEVPTASGLLGRWGLNEGSGLSVANSAGSYANGGLSNGVAWVHGYPFAQLGTG